MSDDTQAILITLTDEQLEQIENNDVASIRLDSGDFLVFGHKRCQDELHDALTDEDEEIGTIGIDEREPL
jgi:hypothetical protein